MRLPQITSDLAFYEKEIKGKLRFKPAIKSPAIASASKGGTIASGSTGDGDANIAVHVRPNTHSRVKSNSTFDGSASCKDNTTHRSKAPSNSNGCNSGTDPDENIRAPTNSASSDLDSASFSPPCTHSYTPISTYNYNYSYNYGYNHANGYGYSHNDFPLSSIPKTITVLNNNVLHGYNSEPPSAHNYFDLNFDDHIDYDYIGNGNANTAFNPHYGDCLHHSYNKNNTLISNTAFIQSFSSLNSSLDAGSSPPISRSGSPLRSQGLNPSYSRIDSILSDTFHNCSQTHINNIKKRKIENSPELPSTPFSFDSTMNLLAFANDESLSHYSFQLSPFSEDRLKLIKSLASKEYMDSISIDSILSLFTSQNLKIKLAILKRIINLSDDSLLISHSNLEKSWLLQIRLTDINNILDPHSNDTDYFQLYKYLMIDFIIMLSLVDSTIAYIVQNYHVSFAPLLYPQSEEEILSRFLNSMDTNTINEIRTHCPLNSFDSDLLDRLAYLLWKTEDPSVCNQFRQLL